MTKKKALKISINEDTIREVKKQIPNLSEFVENVFNNYLNSRNSTKLEIKNKIKKLETTIENNQYDLYIQRQALADTENLNKINEKKLNTKWKKLITLLKNNTDIEKAFNDKYHYNHDEITEILNILHLDVLEAEHIKLFIKMEVNKLDKSTKAHMNNRYFVFIEYMYEHKEELNLKDYQLIPTIDRLCKEFVE